MKRLYEFESGDMVKLDSGELVNVTYTTIEANPRVRCVEVGTARELVVSVARLAEKVC